jgi:hypothetical protein
MNCGAKHLYHRGHILGSINLIAYFISTIWLFAFADGFANVSNGIYTTSGLQLAIKFGGLLLLFPVLGFTFGEILGRFFILRARNRK